MKTVTYMTKVVLILILVASCSKDETPDQLAETEHPEPEFSTTTTSANTQAVAWHTDERYGSWENGGYNLYNNIWGMVQGSVQVMWANSFSNWGVWASHPNTGGIKSYPNSGRHVNININNLNSCSSGFNINVPSAGHYVAAYDIWCNNHDYEIMLWMNKRGEVSPISYNWSAAGNPIPVATNVHLGGHSWDIYNGHNGNESQGIGNRVFSFVRRGNTSAGTVDVKAILDWIKNRTAQTPNEKWFRNEAITLSQVQFGYEISGSSGGLDFVTNNYWVSF